MRVRAVLTYGFLVVIWAALPLVTARETVSPVWVDEVQTYCMVPVRPQRAVELGVTVNGVWGGVGSSDPVLPPEPSAVALQFGDCRGDFLQTCRREGLITVGFMNGIEGFSALAGKYPDLEAMACRRADGSVPRTDQFILMCVNNPQWIEAEIEIGTEAVDAGVDLVILDTPMSASFLSSGMLKAGLCSHCMENFREYLEREFRGAEISDQLALAEFDSQAVMARLRKFQDNWTQRNAFLEDSADARLFRAFIRSQEDASFRTRKRVLDAVRDHAAAQGRRVAFCTNGADLGTQNPFGHWVRALMFADLVDFFAYELAYLPEGGFPEHVEPLPRGKWAAFHKLAHAIHGRRSPAVLHASMMGEIHRRVVFQNEPATAWMAVRCAEAFAANGSYTLFFVDVEPLDQVLIERCWARAIEINRFVLRHRDLYAGELRSGSDAAVLFLLNERGRSIPAVYPSYLGVVQALVEGGYAFDVLFDGDGEYVKDDLSTEQLRGYRTLIIPSPIDPTDRQREALRQFLGSGGTLVCQEPERLGIETALRPSDLPGVAGTAAHGDGTLLRIAGEVTRTWTNDMGACFFRNQDPVLRDDVWALADQLGLQRVVRGGGLVGAFPIRQPERSRVVVHLVNYDVDYRADRTRPKRNIEVGVSHSSFPSGEPRARLVAPGLGKPTELETTVSKGTVTCRVPVLDIAASVVFSWE